MAKNMAVEESKLDKLIEHVMVHYRWIFVMFLLPVSFLYDIMFYLRNWIVFKLSSAPKKHLQKVQTVQRQVKKWHEEGSTKNMCTARPGMYLNIGIIRTSHRPYLISWPHRFNFNSIRLANYITAQSSVQEQNAPDQCESG